MLLCEKCWCKLRDAVFWVLSLVVAKNASFIGKKRTDKLCLILSTYVKYEKQRVLSSRWLYAFFVSVFL